MTSIQRARVVGLQLLVLTAPALLLLGVALELCVRVLLPVADIPDTVFHPTLGNHYAPHQQGTFAVGASAEIRAPYRINGQGWRSPHEFGARRPGAHRVAVIGDSFVEALQVPYAQSFPARIEEWIRREIPSTPHEVFAYGHAGASLAQYLNVLRSLSHTEPDAVVVNLVHNDFQDSLFGFGRKDNLTLRPLADGAFEDVPPRPVSNLQLKRAVRHSALARYLIGNLRLNTGGWIRGLFYGDTRRYQANVDLDAQTLLDQPALLRALLRHLLAELRAAAPRAHMLLVVDADRTAIYNGEDPRASDVYAYNDQLRRAGEAAGIAVVDLTDAFEASWRSQRQRFDWTRDFHWNPHGHAVVANVVGQWLQAQHTGPVTRRGGSARR